MHRHLTFDSIFCDPTPAPSATSETVLQSVNMSVTVNNGNPGFPVASQYYGYLSGGVNESTYLPIVAQGPGIFVVH